MPWFFGKLDTGLTDRIDAIDLLGPGVEHEIAVLGLAVREDLEQNEGADFGVVDRSVVERLIGVDDGLAIDALAILGVVLDFDREIAANRLHEDFVEDVDVRVAARDVILAHRRCPFEVVGRGEDVVALAAVVDVAHGAVGCDCPTKHAHVVDVLADLEHGEQLFADGSQLEELGLFIIMIELLELFDELGVGEEVAGRILRNLRNEMLSSVLSNVCRLKTSSMSVSRLRPIKTL